MSCRRAIPSSAGVRAPARLKARRQERPAAQERGQGPVYYNALFDVPNPDRILRVGKTVEVSILLEAAKGVLAIPTAALGEQAADGRFTVQTLSADGKLQTRQIRAGVSNHALTEVLDGLQEGEEVVTGELTSAPRVWTREFRRDGARVPQGWRAFCSNCGERRAAMVRASRRYTRCAGSISTYARGR